MNPVHGNGKAFMCLLGDRAVGHGPCLKPPYNGFHAFHLVQGNASVLREIKIHQGAQVVQLILPVNLGRILFEDVITACSDRLLEKVDGQRIIKVVLLAGA